jgi:hypothetical protein
MMTSDRREWKKKTYLAEPTYWDKGTMMMMMMMMMMINRPRISEYQLKNHKETTHQDNLVYTWHISIFLFHNMYG